MTVLIGLKQDKYVTITADTKSTHTVVVNNEMKILDTYDTIPKVFHISENIIIGIAGINGLGQSIVKTLQSVFTLVNDKSVEEIVKYVEKTCVYNHNMYEEVHPQRNSNLLFIVAGIDSQKNETYLYRFSSQDKFKPNEIVKGDLIVRGSQQKKIEEFFQRPDLYEIYNEDVEILSAAIRSIDDQLVSKNTYSITITYDEIKGFEHSITAVDSNGILKYLDLNGNAIPIGN